MKALIAAVSVAGLLLVGACGYGGHQASAKVSGPTVVTRIDGHVLYKFCDNSRIVYFTSAGGVAIGTGGTC